LPTGRSRVSPATDWVRSCLLCCLFALVTGAAVRAASDPPQYEWANVSRIVAFGNVHGSYDKLITLLKATGVVNDALVWDGGRTHLVFIGDLIDRGRRETDFLDFGKMFLPQGRRIARSDSTKAFPTSVDPGPDLPSPCGPLDPELELGLRSLSRQKVSDALGSLLSPQQIDGLLLRRDRILEIYDVPLPQSGE
jgi:hypothetical protein